MITQSAVSKNRIKNTTNKTYAPYKATHTLAMATAPRHHISTLCVFPVLCGCVLKSKLQVCIGPKTTHRQRTKRNSRIHHTRYVSRYIKRSQLWQVSKICKLRHNLYLRFAILSSWGTEYEKTLHKHIHDTNLDYVERTQLRSSFSR